MVQIPAQHPREMLDVATPASVTTMLLEIETVSLGLRGCWSCFRLRGRPSLGITRSMIGRAGHSASSGVHQSAQAFVHMCLMAHTKYMVVQAMGDKVNITRFAEVAQP